MPTTTKNVPKTEAREGQLHAGMMFPFEQIDQPGCYVSIETGRMLRFPPEALAFGHSPFIEVLGNKPWFLTRISDDPYLPLSKARMIAADYDLNVNF